jgi:transposase-like protein
MAKRQRFDRERKLEILRDTESKPLSEVCREYNICAASIYRWRREQQQYPKDAFKGNGNAYKLEAQVAKYERLIGQLYAENALLKKAIALAQEKQAEERMLRSTK